jgi:hypothetical protein
MTHFSCSHWLRQKRQVVLCLYFAHTISKNLGFLSDSLFFFVAYRSRYQSPSCQCSRIRFYVICHNFITSFGDHITRTWQFAVNRGRIRQIAVPDLPQWKTNFNFHDDMIQKLMYHVPNSILGIQIPGCLDPDLYGQIRILERTMAVRSQWDSEL